jgi:hypothetical protein
MASCSNSSHRILVERGGHEKLVYQTCLQGSLPQIHLHSETVVLEIPRYDNLIAAGLPGKLALVYADENVIYTVSQEGVNVGAWDPHPAWAVGIVIASIFHFGSIDGHGLHGSRCSTGN